MLYEGMQGTIALGADRLAKNIRAELNLPEPCIVNLSTCEVYQDAHEVRRISSFILVPTLAKTRGNDRVSGALPHFR
jgi:hypothetical protein